MKVYSVIIEGACGAVTFTGLNRDAVWDDVARYLSLKTSGAGGMAEPNYISIRTLENIVTVSDNYSDYAPRPLRADKPAPRQ
jgi:hypothetical protein